MAYTKAKLRRAYFALAKSFGMSEEDRHAWNQSRVGKESTRAWSYQDWKDAVAALQLMAGQGAAPGRPRLKAEKGVDAVESGDFATERQCELIETLCDQVAWRLGREHGPRAYVVKHFLADARYALVKARLGEAEGPARWRRLPRLVARDLIIALRKMARAYPLRETVG